MTRCEVVLSGLWNFTIVRGDVTERTPSGDSWDGFGGLPDPYVCVTIAGDRRCTSTVQDTLSPVWNASYPPVTATALLGGVRVEYWDEDVSVSDPICGAGLIPVTEGDLRSGTWGAGCTSGNIEVRLAPR